MASNGHSNGHNAPHGYGAIGGEATEQGVTQELVGRVFTTSPAFMLTMLVLGVLFVLGIVAFIVKAGDGFEDRSNWGYYIATFSFLITVFGSAPIVAIAFRITRNHFRRAASRASEMFSLVGVLSVLMFIPMIAMLPSFEGRRSIWFEVPFHGSLPGYSDFAAVIVLVVCGLGLLYISALPDMAAVRERGAGTIRGLLYTPLVKHWRGTERQWAIHKGLIAILGALYFMMLIFVHLLVSADFSLAMVPGWIDSIMPAHHALAGLQSGLAAVVVAAFLLRTFGGYKEYIGRDFFWSCSKLLLAMSLLWGYFWFAEFNTFWYGRKPEEQANINFLMVEAYAFPFYMNMFGNFLIPFGMLIWNHVRRCIIGPTIASCFILVGTLFMMIRFYVPASSIEDLGVHSIVQTAEAHPEQLAPIWPGGLDILFILGGISGALFIFLLGTRLLPVLSVWEIKEGLLYQVMRPLIRGRYLVLGKPE